MSISGNKPATTKATKNKDTNEAASLSTTLLNIYIISNKNGVLDQTTFNITLFSLAKYYPLHRMKDTVGM
jgi:hypothetical protein